MIKKPKMGRPRIIRKRGRPKDENDLFKLNAEITKEQSEKLKWLAEQNEISVSRVIREMIDLFPNGKNLLSTRRKNMIKEHFESVVLRNRIKKTGEIEED